MNPESFLPFVLGAIFFCVPLVMVLTRHQQRMAQILRGQDQDRARHEVEQHMLAELAALRQAVARQSATIDELARAQRPSLEESNVRERLLG